MSLERMPGPAGPEPTPPAATEASASPSPAALQLQVLATEHWGLLATRGLAWNESFTRGGIFLSALSGGIVALALVAQATAFGEGFILFALVILPVLLFIGLTTYVRMGAANYYDALCVVGMNRIRHRYVELTPEVKPYLVMASHDDERSVDISMGLPPGFSFAVSIVASAPFVVTVINGVVAGALGAILANLAQLPPPVMVGTGLAVGVVVIAVQVAVARRGIAAAVAALEPKFPEAADSRS